MSKHTIDAINNQIGATRRLLDRTDPYNESETYQNYQLKLRSLQVQLRDAQESERRKPTSLGAPVLTISGTKPAARQKHGLNEKNLRDLLYGGARFEMRDIFTTTSGVNTQQNYQEWVLATKAVGPLLGLVTKFSRIGQPQVVKATVADDTSSTMSYVAEGGSTPEADPSSIVAVINGSDTVVTKVRYSVEIEQDAYQFQQFLTSIAAARVGRALNWVLTNGVTNDGTNTAMPNNVSLLSSAAVAGTSANTISAASPLGYATDLIGTLKTAVDPSYRANAVYLVSQALHDQLEGYVNGLGAPFFDHDDQGNLLIAGQKALVNTAMSLTSGQPAVAYGSFDKAIAYLDGGSQIKIVRELPGLIEARKAEAIIYSRIGSSALLSSAVKVLLAK